MTDWEMSAIPPTVIPSLSRDLVSRPRELLASAV
jgi:hypothetical protein